LPFNTSERTNDRADYFGLSKHSPALCHVHRSGAECAYLRWLSDPPYNGARQSKDFDDFYLRSRVIFHRYVSAHCVGRYAVQEPIFRLPERNDLLNLDLLVESNRGPRQPALTRRCCTLVFCVPCCEASKPLCLSGSSTPAGMDRGRRAYVVDGLPAELRSSI
jgi:hypothetical protein